MLLDCDPGQKIPKALDAAMPAVAALRTFDKSGAASSQHHVLVLWGRGGAFTAHCKLERIGDELGSIRVTIANINTLLAQRSRMMPAASEPEPYGGSLERLERRAGSRSSQTDADSRVLNLASSVARNVDVVSKPVEAPEPDVQRDDRTVLRMIAQRIEEGVRLGAVPQRAVDQIESAAPPVEPNRSEGEQQISPIAPAAGLVGTIVAKSAGGGKADASQLPDADQVTLSEILAQTAHDIKTPLSAISAAAEIIRDERLGPAGNERYRTYAADIHASARHALDIVDRLMRLPGAAAILSTKADAALPLTGGTAAPSPAPASVVPAALEAATSPVVPAPIAAAPPVTIDVNALVAGCVAELTPLIEAQQLHLSAQLDPTSPYAGIDAIGMKQALLNLLTNAMKFTASGGAIQVETAQLASGDVAISVSDNGHGMTKGAIARHLNGEGAKKRTKTGLGLGLPQVREFCQLNGAALAIDSTLGRGTRATMTFPAGTVEPMQAQLQML